MSIHLLTRPAQRSPLTEVHESRHQRGLAATAALTGILSITLATIAMVTIGLGA